MMTLWNNPKEGDNDTLVISNSNSLEGLDLKLKTQPFRHISALNWLDKVRKYTYGSSLSLEGSSLNLPSNVKEEGSRGIVFEASIMPNAIKIIHSRDSSNESPTPKKLKFKNSHKNSSFTSQRVSCASIRFEKENEQPNLVSNNKPGHLKSDTVIWYSNEESQKYQLEKVLKACIGQNLDSSLMDSSSFLYRTDNSNQGNFTDRGPRSELWISPDAEHMIKSLQEALKRQNMLEKKVSELEKQREEFLQEQHSLRTQIQKSEAQKSLLLDKVSSLQKELGSKHNLAVKCNTLERQLRDAEHAIKKIDSNLKSSENRRITLTRQLEEKILESEDKTRRMKERLCGSPGGFNRTEREFNFISDHSNSELFQDVNNTLSMILEKFKYPEYLVGLSLKEDKSLKEVKLRFSKYPQLGNFIFGFINTLAKIISLKATWEKYIKATVIVENPNNHNKKRHSLGKKRVSLPKDKKLSKWTHEKKNQSINDPSNVDDSGNISTYEKVKNEFTYSKSTLRKNIYESLPKKLMNERKGSTPANHSVLTDNFMKIEDSVTSKYTTNPLAEYDSQSSWMGVYLKSDVDHHYHTSRNGGLQLQNSTFKYFSKGNAPKNAKLPMSKSLKNIHEKSVSKKLILNGSGQAARPHNYFNATNPSLNFHPQPNTKPVLIRANKGINAKNNLVVRQAFKGKFFWILAGHYFVY